MTKEFCEWVAGLVSIYLHCEGQSYNSPIHIIKFIIFQFELQSGYYILHLLPYQGGQSNNIEESTVMSLFASGYETKVGLVNAVHDNTSVKFIRSYWARIPYIMYGIQILYL